MHVNAICACQELSFIYTFARFTGLWFAASRSFNHLPGKGAVQVFHEWNTSCTRSCCKHLYVPSTAWVTAPLGFVKPDVTQADSSDISRFFCKQSRLVWDDQDHPPAPVGEIYQLPVGRWAKQLKPLDSITIDWYRTDLFSISAASPSFSLQQKQHAATTAVRIDKSTHPRKGTLSMASTDTKCNRT